MRMKLCSRKKFQIRLTLLLILFAGFTAWFLVRLSPNYRAFLRLYAKNTATLFLNEGLSEISAETSALFTLHRGEDGRILAAEADGAAIARLRSSLIQTLRKKIENNSSAHLEVPFGSLFRYEPLSGLGPRIPIRILPTGFARVDFRQEYESAGINQVRHSLLLDAEMTVSVISCGITRTESVQMSIPVSETVIVGNVPRYYSASSAPPLWTEGTENLNFSENSSFFP